MKSENILAGIVLILASGLLLASHDAMTKHLALSLSVPLILWVRYCVQSLLLPLMFMPKLGTSLFHSYRPVLQLLRGVSLLAVGALIISGLRHIPLAETTAVIFLAPLFVTLLSAVLLREQVRLVQWLAIGLGLLGVLLVVRPGGELFVWPILYPLAAALCFAFYQLITRLLAGKDHPATSNFYSGLVGALLLTPVVLMQLDVSLMARLSLLDIGMLLGLGVLAMGGHMLLTQAFRYATAAVLAPFTYGQIISACLVGWVAFGQLPDMLSLLGVVVIICSGIWMGWLQMRH